MTDCTHPRIRAKIKGYDTDWFEEDRTKNRGMRVKAVCRACKCQVHSFDVTGITNTAGAISYARTEIAKFYPDAKVVCQL
jgi:hypothetical protein